MNNNEADARYSSNVFALWGRFVYRWRHGVLMLSGLLLLASVAMILHGGSLRGASGVRGEAAEASLLVNRELGRPSSTPTPSGPAFDVIFSSSTLSARDPAFREAVLAALAPLRGDPRVLSIRTSYDDAGSPVDAFVSKDGSRLLTGITVRGPFKAAERQYPAVRALIHSDTLDVLATGTLAIQSDFDRLLDGDLHRAEVLSLPLALVLLLMVFGTVVGALLPLGVGLLALAGGIAGAFALSRVTDVSPYALNIVALIGLGVSIDYSLFILSRFREELAGGHSVENALVRSMATAGRAITFSGITVAIGLSGMLFYGKEFASLGMAGAIVVALSILYALTFLPSLLAILGPRVNRWRLPLGRPVPRRRVWHAIATGVMRRPIAVLVPTLAFLLIAGSPFLGIRLAEADTTGLPPNLESRRGAEVVQQEFPAVSETRIVVVADFRGGRPLARDRIGVLYDLSRRIAAIPGVRRVESLVNLNPGLDRADYQRLYAGPNDDLPPAAQQAVRTTVGEHVVVLRAITSEPATSDAARSIVRGIRAQPQLDGGRVLVTGATAFDLDSVEFTIQRTPPAVATVTLVTYVVLFLLLGSLLLPLKAVVMNLLSLSASFGAMVWIFQQGHLRNLLNFTPASIDPVLPVLLFCIVFGLSMDYEVFLLSRIQEEYRRTGDNRGSVAQGLERSGRLVTGAAAIMVAVFSAFALGDVLVVKSVGLAMAVAVAIDATIVRALVVPATMRLLGKLNWWAPPVLARMHRRLGAAEPASERV